MFWKTKLPRDEFLFWARIINRKLEQIMAELEERFNAVGAKLDEASAEILAEIATLKSQPLTPEQEAALANIEAKANALADIAPALPPAP